MQNEDRFKRLLRLLLNVHSERIAACFPRFIHCGGKLILGKSLIGLQKRQNEDGFKRMLRLLPSVKGKRIAACFTRCGGKLKLGKTLVNKKANRSE